MNSKTQLFFLFLFYSLFNIFCKKFECEQYREIDKNLGEIYLDTTNKIWTPNENGIAIFKNKAGSEIRFTISHSNYTNKNNLFANNAFYQNKCERAGFVYCLEEEAHESFQCQSMPLKFTFVRLKIIPYPLSDTTTLAMISTFPEQILLRTLDEVKSFYIQDSERYFIGDTTLNGSIYSSVYRVNFISGKSTKCFYLQKNKGLVGVAFNNGELFSR
jgi:hypothetical protein